MGEWTEADKTSMVMPIGGLISGLTVVAGGIAAIVFGTQANEREAGSGQATLTGGITAIIAGSATATAGIVAICRKIAEVIARDDGTGNDNVMLGQTNDVLSQLAAEADHDAARLRELVNQTV